MNAALNVASHDDLEELPDAAWTTALLSLPKMGPRRLDALVEREGGVRSGWERICNDASLRLPNTAAQIIEDWRSAARSFNVGDRWAAMNQLGISAVIPGDPGYPTRLLDDIHRPRIIYRRGTLPDRPTVGIVGTRTCTAYGQRCAFEFGQALADAGIAVVSGLALGIDAAAHNGALTSESAGAAIGVVGSGLDVVYPRRNRHLWERVAEAGALLSETPPGIPPAPWRFPARNRIIAALSDAVVVIESHARGGSLLTVDEAQLRDVAVGAVPGPITSAAAAGTNQLLVDGAVPILTVDDIFAMIGFSAPAVVDTSSTDATHSSVLNALGWTPLLFEQLCLRVSLTTAELAGEIEQLCLRGFVEREGPWIERVR